MDPIFVIETYADRPSLIERAGDWISGIDKLDVAGFLVIGILVCVTTLLVLLMVALVILFFRRKSDDDTPDLVRRMREADVETRVAAAARLLAAYVPVDLANAIFWVDNASGRREQAAFQVRMPGGAPIAIGGDATSAVMALLAPETDPLAYGALSGRPDTRRVRQLERKALTGADLNEIEAAFDLAAPAGSLLAERRAARRSRTNAQMALNVTTTNMVTTNMVTTTILNR